jgi:hypothetical protein
MDQTFWLEYVVYMSTIILAVWMSYRNGAREGLEMGVEMALDKLEREGAIRMILDSNGEISDIVPGIRVQKK